LSLFQAHFCTPVHTVVKGRLQVFLLVIMIFRKSCSKLETKQKNNKLFFHNNKSILHTNLYYFWSIRKVSHEKENFSVSVLIYKWENYIKFFILISKSTKIMVVDCLFCVCVLTFDFPKQQQQKHLRKFSIQFLPVLCFSRWCVSCVLLML
jgi:hypothetical protein